MQFPFSLILVIFLLAGCNNKPTTHSNQQTALNDTAKVAKTAPVTNDSTLRKLTKEVLTAFKNKDYKLLASLVHPDEGVRFSPHAFIDTKDDKVMQAHWIKSQSILSSQQIIRWGTTDANEKPIQLTFNDYIDQYIYDEDFLHAHKASVNEFIGSGTTLNNLKEVYPDGQFTESHFTGFDKKAEGMDWKSLRLVFKSKNGKLYLVGVVHAEWSI